MTSITANLIESALGTESYQDILYVDRDFSNLLRKYGLEHYETDDGDFAFKGSDIILDGRYMLMLNKFYATATGRVGVAAKIADVEHYDHIIRRLLEEWELHPGEYVIETNIQHG